MKKPKIIEGNLFTDDRGFLSFVNDFNFSDIKRFYMVENHQQGFIRAWHGHKKEEKYIFVVQGSAKICVVPLKDLEIMSKENRLRPHLTTQILTSKSPKIMYIPPGYANGFMTLEKETKIMFFSTSTLEESKDDDFRFKWNIIDCWNIEYR